MTAVTVIHRRVHTTHRRYSCCSLLMIKPVFPSAVDLEEWGWWTQTSGGALLPSTMFRETNHCGKPFFSPQVELVLSVLFSTAWPMITVCCCFACWRLSLPMIGLAFNYTFWCTLENLTTIVLLVTQLGIHVILFRDYEHIVWMI